MPPSKGANAMQHAENITPADLKDKIHKHIDEMDEYQARLVLSFLKTLFNLSD